MLLTFIQALGHEAMIVIGLTWNGRSWICPQATGTWRQQKDSGKKWWRSWRFVKVDIEKHLRNMESKQCGYGICFTRWSFFHMFSWGSRCTKKHVCHTYTLCQCFSSKKEGKYTKDTLGYIHHKDLQLVHPGQQYSLGITSNTVGHQGTQHLGGLAVDLMGELWVC